MIRNVLNTAVIFGYLSILCVVVQCFSFSEDSKPREDEDVPKEISEVRKEMSLLLLSNLLQRNAEEIPSTEDDLAPTIPSKIQFANPRQCNCCERKMSPLAIGIDITGVQRYVDVGKCRRSCKKQHHRRHRNHHHKRYQNSTQPKESFSSLQGFDITNLLQDKREVCQPLVTRVQKHHLQRGPSDVEVVDSCHCVSESEQCARTSHRVIFYEHSPYEVEVDVGTCRGVCHEEHRCFPLKNRTITVEGPNGAKCVEVVEECQCSGSCYRMTFRESFHEGLWNETTNSTVKRIKNIDVGRCAGSCDDFHKSQFHCVFRDPIDPERCLMSLKKSAPRCVPVKFSTHAFLTTEGVLKEVLSVDQCGCQ
ncbi:uncharacterized protein LOC143258009 [Tachypleus tridentatus]|uniref:uncharacterized protein LOC143258009 n=1 Tax=Tachypleus tridentatus TaxID=6853 RepID=UPI003FD3B699